MILVVLPLDHDRCFHSLHNGIGVCGLLSKHRNYRSFTGQVYSEQADAVPSETRQSRGDTSQTET